VTCDRVRLAGSVNHFGSRDSWAKSKLDSGKKLQARTVRKRDASAIAAHHATNLSALRIRCCKVSVTFSAGLHRVI
jgi:hypothetical protein